MAVSTALDAVRLGSSEVAALYLGSDSVWTANAPGIVLVKPTSITHSGTSATLGANGQVTFTAVTSLSLNGVFSADFDNYVVNIRYATSNNGPNVGVRLRASGSDASGSDYARQYLGADSTSLLVARQTSQTIAKVLVGASAQRSGEHFAIYGPYLAQPTAMRTDSANGYLNAYIRSAVGTHSLSTSYDGFSLIPDSGDMTGALQVYGVRS